jgi:crossover junction endodeoxyribonuclease RuvC
VRILGIDPGLRLTGYGVLDYHVLKPRLIDAGVVRLKSKTSLADRLVELETVLDEIITEHKPGICAVEQLYSNYAHPRTAILMAHARGVILLMARRHGLRVEQFAANRIKQSLTGHGHAAKGQMQRAIQSVFHLKDVPEPPDVADALAVALCCGLQLSREPKHRVTPTEEDADLDAVESE